MNLRIRTENKNDYLGVYEVHKFAFEQTNESELVENLRMTNEFVPELSILVENESKIVGHILFFPIQVKSNESSFESLALAPLAVLPKFQKQGIGKKLVFEGLKRAKNLGFKSVIVLGDPIYYGKFGFEPSVKWQILSPYKVSAEYFMALELENRSLENVFGTVVYPKEFDVV
ncbi:MAG: N-acetyltransferase [Calditrichaeota bacterium]|nr:MAG: N-acetyltransferase [Calditrichota bacterium]